MRAFHAQVLAHQLGMFQNEIQSSPLPVGEVLRQEVLNVVPIAGIRQAMGTTALNAFLQMRRAGQKDIRVSIQADGNSTEYNTETVALQMHKRWMQMANMCAVAMKPPNDMTQEEKFAICVAAKVPLKPIRDPNALRMETLHPCAIVIEEGQYLVYQLPERD